MRWRLVSAVAAALVACAATGASAGGAPLSHPDQSGVLVPFGGGSGTLVSSTRIPVRIRGALAVQFHGDQATGCAARGLCGFSGTVIWQPPSTGSLETDTFRDHGNTEYDASLELFGGASAPFGPPVDGGVTTADVRFAPAGSAGSPSLCTDATATGASISMPVHLRATSVSLAAATPSLLATRCAGPLESDVARLLARRVIDVAALSNGRTSVSLASSGDFAVDGLAGTVTSTVQLSLGRPHTQRVPTSGVSGLRTVEVDYRAHLDGSLVLHTQGDPSSCAGLGSCGSRGRVALRLHSGTQPLEFIVVTRASRPLRDALTALGLRHDGNPRGIPVFGVFLEDGPATSAVHVAQGGATCKDTGPGGPAEVFLSESHGRLSAGFAPALQALHLRCPGPLLSEEGNGLAAGTAHIGLLGRRSGTIRLRSGVNVHEPGYRGRTVADLALTFSHPTVKVTTDALPGRG